jgi:hypothetical protein
MCRRLPISPCQRARQATHKSPGARVPDVQTAIATPKFPNSRRHALQSTEQSVDSYVDSNRRLSKLGGANENELQASRSRFPADRVRGSLVHLPVCHVPVSPGRLAKISVRRTLTFRSCDQGIATSWANLRDAPHWKPARASTRRPRRSRLLPAHLCETNPSERACALSNAIFRQHRHFRLARVEPKIRHRLFYMRGK